MTQSEVLRNVVRNVAERLAEQQNGQLFFAQIDVHLVELARPRLHHRERLRAIVAVAAVALAEQRCLVVEKHVRRLFADIFFVLFVQRRKVDAVHIVWVIRNATQRSAAQRTNTTVRCATSRLRSPSAALSVTHQRRQCCCQSLGRAVCPSCRPQRTASASASAGEPHDVVSGERIEWQAQAHLRDARRNFEERIVQWQPFHKVVVVNVVERALRKQRLVLT